MTDTELLIKDFKQNGFITRDSIYNDEEIAAILLAINNAPAKNDAFRKTDDLFAIRHFLNEVSAVVPLVFNNKLKTLITDLFGNNYFVTKTIYFDKPPKSNWFVAYHQDLTISVNKRIDLPGYGPWTVKRNQFAVQPPMDILEKNFTIRIHLDDTNEHNGALKVISGSNLKGIYRPETIDWNVETETICPVKKGGIMIMHPLLLHASNRSTNEQSRRVIHIEFSQSDLPAEINWSEKYNYREAN